MKPQTSFPIGFFICEFHIFNTINNVIKNTFHLRWIVIYVLPIPHHVNHLTLRTVTLAKSITSALTLTKEITPMLFTALQEGGTSTSVEKDKLT